MPRSLAACLLALAAVSPALAAPPTLAPDQSQWLPATLGTGKTAVVRLQYKDADGDAPSRATMTLTPSGGDGSPATIPATDASKQGDAAQGLLLEFPLRVESAGTYKVSFLVGSSADEPVRYPTEPANDPVITVESPWMKLGLLIGGILICILGMPLVFFMVSRAINPRGEPTVAARLGLLAGLMLGYLLFAYLYWAALGPLYIAAALVGVLVLMVLVFVARR
jgi:hypothetical protein